MEVTLPKTGKYAWTFGFLGGITAIIFSFMIYTMKADEQSIAVQLVGFVILAVAIVLAIIQFKKANEGFISLSEGLKLGAGVGLVMAILIILYVIIFTYVIDPEHVATLVESAKQKALATNPQMTDEQWDMGMKIQKYVQYPVILIIDVVVGLIVGAITGAIVQNKRPE